MSATLNMLDTRKKDFHKIEGILRPLSFDYTGKFLKRPCNDMNMLEYGLIHRNGAVHYHFEVLNTRLNVIRDKALKDGHNFLSQNLGFDFKLGFMFDDLTFNMMSFYDYFASYIGYILYDQEIREKAQGYDPLNPKEHKYDHLEEVLYKLSWTKIAELSKSPPERNKIIGIKNNKLKETSLAKTISEHDLNFIEPLSRFRNRVIHNAAASPSIKFVYVLTGKNEIQFRTPAPFLDKFENYSDDFIEVLCQLINDYLNSLQEIIEQLSAFIEENRRIPEGEEIYMYEHEIKKYREKGLID